MYMVFTDFEFLTPTLGTPMAIQWYIGLGSGFDVAFFFKCEGMSRIQEE